MVTKTHARPGRPPLSVHEANVPVCVRVTVQQYDRVYTLARQQGVTIPEVVRRALQTELGVLKKLQ